MLPRTMPVMATALRIGAALLVGFAVFFVLAPTSGSGIGCSSLLFREVPCGGAMAAAAGLAAALIVGVGIWLLSRGRATRDR